MRKEMLVVAGALFLASSATAGIVVWDIEADEQGWRDLLAREGKVAKGGWDFDLDPDYGITGFDGPLTSAGAGPVSPGIINTDNITINTRSEPFNNLVAVGPSAGFGNGSNAIVANYFEDQLTISFSEEKSAIEFSALTLLGSNVIDIYVNGDRVAIDLPAPPAGHRYGIIDRGGDGLTSIMFLDPNGGAEGVMGQGVVYVPAPGALALLGAVCLVLRRRRRCSRPRE